VLSCILQSKKERINLRIKNSRVANVTSKRTSKGSKVITEQPATRRMRTNQRAIRIYFYPGGRWGLPNHQQNITDTTVMRRNRESIKDICIRGNAFTRRDITTKTNRRTNTRLCRMHRSSQISEPQRIPSQPNVMESGPLLPNRCHALGMNNLEEWS